MELNNNEIKNLFSEYQNQIKEANLIIDTNENLTSQENELIKLSLNKIKETYNTKYIKIKNNINIIKIEGRKGLLDFKLKYNEEEDTNYKEITKLNDKILRIKDNNTNLNNEIFESKKNIKINEENIKNYEIKILKLKNFKTEIITLKLKKKKEEEKYDNIDIFFKNKIKKNLNNLNERKIKVEKKNIYINKKKIKINERIKSILNLINNFKLNGKIKYI